MKLELGALVCGPSACHVLKSDDGDILVGRSGRTGNSCSSSWLNKRDEEQQKREGGRVKAQVYNRCVRSMFVSQYLGTNSLPLHRTQHQIEGLHSRQHINGLLIAVNRSKPDRFSTYHLATFPLYLLLRLSWKKSRVTAATAPFCCTFALSCFVGHFVFYFRFPSLSDFCQFVKDDLWLACPA